MRTGGYTYDQFVNSDWETFEGLARREGGPTGKVQWIPKHNDKQFVG